MKPRFFATPEAFRAWLEKHHATEKELLVGFYKKDSGKKSITWPESVDEALCVGWIDGVRKTIDDISYTIRFTPRKVKSKWSTVNIKRIAELTKLGRMKPEGLAIFEKRDPSQDKGYSYERRKEVQLDAAMEKRFRANKAAWKFWEAQPPYYKNMLTYWIVSAKREETREKRLEQLIAASAEGRRIT